MAGDRIEVTDGPARGEESELDKGLVIGRSTEGFGALKGDPEISRRHAQISRTDEGRLYISDLGSTNGTFVNGTKIEGSAWLAPGDVVKVGQSTLKVGGGAADAGATRIGRSPTSAPTRAGAAPGAAAAGAAAAGAAAGAGAPETGGAAASGPSPGGPSAPAPSPAPAAPPAPGRPAGQGPGPPPPPGAGRPGPGPGAPPPGGGGGGRRIALIIVGAVVALLVIVGVVLAATGAFSSDEKKPKPPPLTVPSTANTVPSVPAQSTPTQTTENTAGKATYIIQFDRIQRSYSKQVARLIKKARNPSSVGDIITAFKRLKTLYGSTATRIGDIETPGEIRPVSRTYTSTLRVSSAGINLIIACARQRSESCYKRRLSSLSSRTRRVRKKFGRDFRARGYPVAVLAPS
ncbi:MAG: FHA domain-containing protein [Solirubrobacteraceae bacterium]